MVLVDYIGIFLHVAILLAPYCSNLITKLIKILINNEYTQLISNKSQSDILGKIIQIFSDEEYIRNFV